MTISELKRIEHIINFDYLEKRTGIKESLLRDKLKSNRRLSKRESLLLNEAIDDIKFLLPTEKNNRKRDTSWVNRLKSVSINDFPQDCTFDREFIYSDVNRGIL
jgi:hypothetical protein